MQHTSVFSPGAHVDDLEIVQLLGSGAYGQVYLGRDQQNQHHYAVKTLSRKPTNNNNNKKTSTSASHRQRGFQRMEIGIHSRLSGHPHIVQLERVIREADYTHLVMEYAPEGDLFTAITERDLFAGNHPLIRRVFLQLLDAVEHCHLNGVYHRDLKSENVLVFDGGRTIKLADFGLATLDPISTDYGCGSTFYFSPECQGDLAKQRQQRVGYATVPNDIWALGVILINLAAGRNPWKQASLQDETFRAYLGDPDFLLKILPISRELNRILKRVFCIDPLRRIGLKELKYRIQQCKYFTRTAEVDRWERLQDLTMLNNTNHTYLYNNNNNSNHHHTNKRNNNTATTIKTSALFDIPPYRKPATPPTTPTISAKKRDDPIGVNTEFSHIDVTTTTTRDHSPLPPPSSSSKQPAADLPPSPPATPRDRSQQSHDTDGDICMENNIMDPATSGNTSSTTTTTTTTTTDPLISTMVPLMA